MEEIKIFNSPQFGEIRTAGTSENPLFCLADVCHSLGLSAKGVNQRLGKEVISNYPLETAGGTQQALFVNEDGNVLSFSKNFLKSLHRRKKITTFAVLKPYESDARLSNKTESYFCIALERKYNCTRTPVC